MDKRNGAEALFSGYRMGSTFPCQATFWKRGTLDLVGSMSIRSNNPKFKVKASKPWKNKGQREKDKSFFKSNQISQLYPKSRGLIHMEVKLD